MSVSLKKYNFLNEDAANFNSPYLAVSIKFYKCHHKYLKISISLRTPQNLTNIAYEADNEFFFFSE
jgi:hypothetical protein